MTSFRDLIAVMFPWMVTVVLFVCMKTFERFLFCLFSPYLIFFIIDNQRGIISYQIRKQPCRARGARAHNLISHIHFRMDRREHYYELFGTHESTITNYLVPTRALLRTICYRREHYYELFVTDESTITNYLLPIRALLRTICYRWEHYYKLFGTDESTIANYLLPMRALL